MSSNDTVKELGTAAELTMDAFLRTAVAQMFENDNDRGSLEVVLEGTNDSSPPTIELEIRLVSINGVKTRGEGDE